MAAQRREVQRRLSHVYFTSDFSSPPKDLVQHLSSMKMDDLRVFLDVVAPYVFSGEVSCLACNVLTVNALELVESKVAVGLFDSTSSRDFRTRP